MKPLEINDKLADEVSRLVKLGRQKGKVVPFEAAADLYPPEGKWHKDKVGKIVIEEI